jgi:uncharacterized Zn finger protein
MRALPDTPCARVLKVATRPTLGESFVQVDDGVAFVWLLLALAVPSVPLPQPLSVKIVMVKGNSNFICFMLVSSKLFLNLCLLGLPRQNRLTEDKYFAPAPFMTTESILNTLSDSSLISMSSAAIFKRAQNYAHGGVVQVIQDSVAPKAEIHAVVKGTSIYSAALMVNSGSLFGGCNCQAGERGWFCKHQVALALVWRARLTGEAPHLDELAQKKVAASAKRAQTVKDNRQALHDFLLGLDAKPLAEKLIEFSEFDSFIAKSLQQWRKIYKASTEATSSEKEFKAAITELLAAGKSMLTWRDCGEYAQRAGTIFALLENAQAKDASLEIPLYTHSIKRLWAAMQRADDSNGEIGVVYDELSDRFQQMLKANKPHGVAVIDNYLKMQQDDPYGALLAGNVADILGDAAMDRYGKALEIAWRKSSTKSDYVARKMYLDYLVQQGDIDTAVEVMKQDLTEGYHYLQLIDLLTSSDRQRDAFTYCERGYKRFPKDWQLENQMLAFYERDGWADEALKIYQRRFELKPSVDSIQALVSAAKLAKKDIKKTRAAIEAHLLKLELGEFEADTKTYNKYGGLSALEPRLNVTLRANLLLAEGKLDSALALVQFPNTCGPSVLEAIAKALPKSKNADAVPLLLRVFESEIRGASSEYSRVIRIVKIIAERMRTNQAEKWLAELRVTYKNRRNFVRDLALIA